MSVSSVVMSDDTFESLDEFEDWQPTGTGGTDMEAAFRHLEDDADFPDVCIVLTDGYTTTSHEGQPDFPVIWVTTQQEDFAYGAVVKMDLSEATPTEKG
mgnify:CR=1 FL=1